MGERRVKVVHLHGRHAESDVIRHRLRGQRRGREQQQQGGEHDPRSRQRMVLVTGGIEW
jgi:hypothetical protein